MSKMWVMTIGYQNYAVSDLADAVKLVDIASRMVRVTGYSEPYVVDRDAPPLVETVTLAEVHPAAVASDPMFAEVAPAPAPVTPQPAPHHDDITPF